MGAGSVISASLFGALAGTVTLPFTRTAFEGAIRASGKGVQASLRAFDAGFAAAQAGVQPAAQPAARPGPPAPQGPARLIAGFAALEARARTLPEPAQDMALAGLRKVVKFQDLAYGSEYLDRLAQVQALDNDGTLTREAAKHIANAMAYDDVIRVADEKTRAARFTRIRAEMGAGEVMQLTDYTHPRGEEIVSLFPARLAHWIHARPALLAWFDRRVNKGRRLRTDRLWPFLQLWLIAGLRRWRRTSLRHGQEMAHLQAWLDSALRHARTNPALAVELLRARRLVKGYSDTHARGLSKFDRVIETATTIALRPDSADWARRLITAALADEEGKALDGAIATIRSF